MNSSGIKRGLAASAISALAIAGLPLLASSASAAPASALQTAYVGPVRDAGTTGGIIVIKTKGVANAAEAANLKIAASDLKGPASDGLTQDIGEPTVLGFEADGVDNEFGGKDGFAEVTLSVPVDTTQVGDTFKFAVYYDADGAGTHAAPDVDTNDVRSQVTGVTSGAPASMTIAPAKQTAPEGVESDDYTLTLKDAAGRLTQLTDGETVGVTSAANVDTDSAVNGTIASDDALRGTATFTASSGSANLYPITASAAGFTASDATAKLDVVASARNINARQLDFVSGKDGFDGKTFSFGNEFPVRVDQKSLTLTIASPDNAGKTVVLSAEAYDTFGNDRNIFGGTNEKTFTVVLDAKGNGSIPIVSDVQMQNFDYIDLFSSSINSGDYLGRASFEKAAFETVESDASVYVSKFGGSVDVPVTAVDQFGDPISGVILAAQRVDGVNADAQPGAKKVTGANGQVVFSFTDTKATASSKAADTVEVYRYQDMNDAPATGDYVDDVAEIAYTETGQGADFTLYNDSLNTEASAYNPNLNPLVSLTDARADNRMTDYYWYGYSINEENEIRIDGGTEGAPVTVSATNGAVVLEEGETTLAEGASTETGEIGDTFRVAGTKAGLTTVTVTSGGVTKTTQMLVEVMDDDNYYYWGDNRITARNVSVSGPSKAVAGQVVTVPVMIMDAFGNPVEGYDYSSLTPAVTGPGEIRDHDVRSGEDGVINVQVQLDKGADSPVTLKVAAQGWQFGAQANELYPGYGDESAPGLTASVAKASVTIESVDVAALEKAVKDAEAAVKRAEADLAAAQSDLDVAMTELSVVQGDVDFLSAKKDRLRDKLNAAKDEDNKQKAKTTRKKLRQTKRDLRAAKGELAVAEAKVAAEQKVVAQRQEVLDQANADLEKAKQDLEDAKQ